MGYVPLVELEKLSEHPFTYIWGCSQRAHRLARLCRLVGKVAVRAFVAEDGGACSFVSQEAGFCSLDEFLEMSAQAKGSEIALLCDGPLPAEIEKALMPFKVRRYEARYTLNLFFPPVYDDHLLDDVAFLRLWSLMLSRRGLAAAVRAQTDLPFSVKAGYDAVTRPYYAYTMIRAAQEAKWLGVDEISAIEFGVAGGNGLLTMEEHAKAIEKETGVRFRIFGFDSGAGLPPSTDYRDQPYAFQGGDYPMDEPKLRARLKDSTLILGALAETAATFWKTYAPPPLGAVMFDLDYYSSTMEAFAVFTSASARRLPRVACYFDDISWSGHIHDGLGELGAIRDFNAGQTDLKLVQARNLDHIRIQPAPWNDQIFVLHDFTHPEYGKPLRTSGHQCRLDLVE